MKKNAGFTLVELAIVLVIIGLIVGGVLAGATLIRNAEMNAIVSEKTNFEAAINTFRLRYKAIPGDMPNATAIWGARDPDPGTCLTTLTTGTETCNGSGDKRVWNLSRFNSSSGAAQMTEIMEVLLIWQHLSNAGLIHGSLNGNTGTGAGIINTEIGVNSPPSKIGEATWFLQYLGEVSPLFAATYTPHVFPGSYSQMIVIGSIREQSFIGPAPIGPLFTTAESLGLDKKIDDGRPSTGILKSWTPAVGTEFENTCATSGDPDTAEYNVVGGNECAMIFKLKI